MENDEEKSFLIKLYLTKNIFTSLSFNVTAIVLDHCLQPGPEALARKPDVIRGHRVPRGHDVSLQGLQVGVGLVAGLPGNVRPDTKIQRIQIWGVGRPKRLWPEGLEVVGQPLLGLVGCMTRSTVLHERVFYVRRVVGFNPRLHHSTQELHICVGVDPGPLWPEERRHDLAVGGNESKHHDGLWMFGPKLESDVFRDIDGPLGAQVTIEAAVGDTIQVKVLFISEEDDTH